MFPITIGTYPILDEDNGQISVEVRNVVQISDNGVDFIQSVMPYPETGSLWEISPQIVSMLSCRMSFTDPPSYEQAILVEDEPDEEEQALRMKFTPRYPVYRRNTSYSSAAGDVATHAPGKG